MTTVTMCLPAHTYTRLAKLAEQHNVSINPLLAYSAIAEFNAKMRFHERVIQGSRKAGISVLDRLDALRSTQIR
jgi:hypothetical protein